MVPAKSDSTVGAVDGDMLLGLEYNMGERGESSSGTSSSSRLARIGDRRPLRVLALELVRERKSVQASSSSLLREVGLPVHLERLEELSELPS